MPIFEWYECDQDDTSMPTNCLPPGLVLETSPGSATTTLHGTPTAIGSYDFWISALDNNDDVGKDDGGGGDYGNNHDGGNNNKTTTTRSQSKLC